MRLSRKTKGVAILFIQAGQSMIEFGCRLLNWRCNLVIDPHEPTIPAYRGYRP
jgi:hypothetical protein